MKQPQHANERLSGENEATFAPFDGEFIMSCRARVTGSRISIVVEFSQVVAMYVLHGDQVAVKILSDRFVVAILESHEFGSPYRTSAMGRARSPYSFHTIDDLGASARAE